MLTIVCETNLSRVLNYARAGKGQNYEKNLRASICQGKKLLKIALVCFPFVKMDFLHSESTKKEESIKFA